MNNGNNHSVESDAKRYRKLRKIAVIDGGLTAEVALGQFDFCTTFEEFDKSVDSLLEPINKALI